MKLQQLKYICEVANRDLNVSEAAELLHTSQPGVSKQIRLLEDELGVPIFTRVGKRLADVTQPGKAILSVAVKILQEAENLKKIGFEFTNEESGTLSFATTHTQARYALPPAIKSFSDQYPDVSLRIHQNSTTSQITDLVIESVVDFAVLTEVQEKSDQLVYLPCYNWNRCLVVLSDHPLYTRGQTVTLEDLTKFPIVTYDLSYAGYSEVENTFREAGLEPNIVITAIDADVIKTYVELGLGIGMLAEMAFEPNRDIYLKYIDISHLFKPSTTVVALRKGAYLRGYMYDFLEYFAPQLTRQAVLEAMNPTRV